MSRKWTAIDEGHVFIMVDDDCRISWIERGGQWLDVRGGPAVRGSSVKGVSAWRGGDRCKEHYATLIDSNVETSIPTSRPMITWPQGGRGEGA